MRVGASSPFEKPFIGYAFVFCWALRRGTFGVRVDAGVHRGNAQRVEPVTAGGCRPNPVGVSHIAYGSIGSTIAPPSPESLLE